MTVSVTAGSRILEALGTVRDPELDEPITSLGFVSSCTVSADGDARVRLRLPTYFCAPNFAFLMVADAYDAVSAAPGVRRTEIVLEDHFASAEINHGVAARAGFVQSFDGLAETELDQLRTDFVRKAMLAAGYVRSQMPVRNVCVLSATVAMVSGRGLRYLKDDKVMAEFGWTYTLLKGANGWRMTAVLTHEPNKAVVCSS